MSAWFTSTTVEERVGGEIVFHLGGGASSEGVITGWEPPLRFTFDEHGWSGDAPPITTEIHVASRSRGTCVVRLVHSLFTTKDSWDGELESFEAGWPGFFRVLESYMRHSPGAAAAALHASAVFPGSQEDGWNRFSADIGVSGVTLGEKRSSPSSAPPLAGTVEHVHLGTDHCEIRLHLHEPAPGLAVIGGHRWKDKGHVALSVFFYGVGAAETAAKHEPKWQAWLKERFPTAG